MAVQASLSNIRHTIVNGVDSDTVIDKALPYVRWHYIINVP
jgi:hypothetical protein